ncbi:MAG TPA: hypothetical protein VFX44_00985 [Solirubrobacterales bacterium]|nr:hypothetical protein [Solirubrobacterales bacterium]
MGVELALGVPAFIVAIGTALSYAVGLIRPVAVKARYWTTEAGAELSLDVKNRLWHRSRSLTKVGLVTFPLLRQRLPGWRRRGGLQPSPYVPAGKRIGEIRDKGIKIEPRDEISIRCRLLTPGGERFEPGERLPERVRVQVHFAGARPAVSKPRLRS